MKPFVPLLADAAHAAKAAGDGFNKIPGPVKTLAIEAGLARSSCRASRPASPP
jgi:hypothetical protein